MSKLVSIKDKTDSGEAVCSAKKEAIFKKEVKHRCTRGTNKIK